MDLNILYQLISMFVVEITDCEDVCEYLRVLGVELGK